MTYMTIFAQTESMWLLKKWLTKRHCQSAEKKYLEDEKKFYKALEEEK